MATYGSLLIDAGGGVIDHSKQSDREPGATVIIGLGGTGKDAVIRLKKEVYRQLKPDDVDKEIPKYKDIRYLIIDSDEDKIGGSRNSDIDRSTEFFSIANSAIKETFAAREVMKRRSELNWLDFEHISIEDASQGAAGIRQVGRFLLVDKAQELYTKIKSTIQTAMVGNSKLTIHICAGISGGTGSGTFLDVCYLVRAVLHGIGQVQTSVCGYFFMPDVNLSVPEISANPLISAYIGVNGFAALKELDYCMNFSKNKDSFKMNYGFKQIDNKQRPVDLCYLISTTNAGGKPIENGYHYAMGVVTDFIINYMAKVNLPAGVTETADKQGLTLGGFISNLSTSIGSIKVQHGANVDYNILGASVAEMPLSEIATYLGSKLFESYAAMYDRIPTEKERNDFLQAAQLKYEDIRRELTKGCSQKINFPQRLDAKLFKERGNEKFVQFADDYLAKNKGVLEQNSKTLTAEQTDYIIPDESTSLISRTYKELCQRYLMNLDYGPFFVQRILYGSQNQNLIHAIDGFISENKEKLDAEIRQSELRSETYQNALQEMERSNRFNEKKKLSEYLNALEQLYVHHYKVDMLQTMNTILQNYKQRLYNLNNNFFEILTDVLDNLRETFAVNQAVLSNSGIKGNGYNWKILSVPDIQEGKKGLDAQVKALNLQKTIQELMSRMMKDYKDWSQKDENKIARLISDFILDTFKGVTQKTITDYLKVKFNVSNFDLLVREIEDEIIDRKVSVDSTPLFWKNPMYKDTIVKKSILAVPYDSEELKQAAYNYAAKQPEYTVWESGIADKISIMQFYSGIPMYAYQGIQELQKLYEEDWRPGRHLYEHGEVNWNEWLPSPVPASFRAGIPIERIEE